MKTKEALERTIKARGRWVATNTRPNHREKRLARKLAEEKRLSES